MDVTIAIDWKGFQYHDYEFDSFTWDFLDEYLNKVVDFRCCLIDSYLAQNHHFKKINELFQSVFVIDDYNRLASYHSNLIINPNIYGNEINYMDEMIGGPDYIILREGLKQHVKKKELSPNLSSLGISVGGNDYRNLLPCLATCLQKTDLTLHIFCGSDKYKSQLDSDFDNMNNVVTYGYLKAEKLAVVLNKIDLMISGGGQSLHELAYAGIPTVVICIDDDQELNIHSYLQAGFLPEKNNWNDEYLCKNILDQIKELQSVSKRKEVSEIGKKIVDGKGVERIIERIKSTL